MIQGRNNMEMINVLKRLAELDSSKMKVENQMRPVDSLMTVSNSPEIDPVAEIAYLAGRKVNECGEMEIPTPTAIPTAPAHSPASINVSANTGGEVSDMLRSLMALAGIDKGGEQAVGSQHQEIELGAPHSAEQEHGGMGGDMNSLIGMIDANSDDEGHDEFAFGNDEAGDEFGSQETDDEFGGHDAGNEFGGHEKGDEFGGHADAGNEFGDEEDDEAGDEEDDSENEFGDEEDETEESQSRPYINSPEEEIEAHDYGDKRVTPKPQGAKQRPGDNPYKPTHEAVNATALRLLKDYKAFVNESNNKK